MYTKPCELRILHCAQKTDYGGHFTKWRLRDVNFGKEIHQAAYMGTTNDDATIGCVQKNIEFVFFLAWTIGIFPNLFH